MALQLFLKTFAVSDLCRSGKCCGCPVVEYYFNYSICSGYFIELFIIYRNKCSVIPHRRAHVFVGLLGEYIGRMYICINNAPQYVIKEKINVDKKRRNKKVWQRRKYWS